MLWALFVGQKGGDSLGYQLMQPGLWAQKRRGALHLGHAAGAVRPQARLTVGRRHGYVLKPHAHGRPERSYAPAQCEHIGGPACPPEQHENRCGIHGEPTNELGVLCC